MIQILQNTGRLLANDLDASNSCEMAAKPSKLFWYKDNDNSLENYKRMDEWST